MKMKKLLGALVLAVMVILPIKVSAATYSITWGDQCDTDKDGYCLVKPVLNQSGGASTDILKATMTLSNMEFVSAEGNEEWNIEVNGLSIIFTPKSGQPITAATSKLGTLKFKKTGDPCAITFTCEEVTKTIEPKPITPNKTGNFLPYAVIFSGIAIAGGVYYVTRRNNKFYKI